MKLRIVTLIFVIQNTGGNILKNLKLLFQGDSITDGGRNKDTNTPNFGLGGGFVGLISSKLLFEHPNTEIYNKGTYGNRITDMYARWIEDTLNIQFNVISIMNGVNDVGFAIRQNRGADSQKYEFVFDRILYETRESHPNADIILCKPFLIKRVYEKENDIYENWDRWNYAIEERGEIVRKLSKQYGALFIEFNTAIDDALKRAPAEHWSLDCIHLTHAGNELLARTWLNAAEPILNKYFQK